MTIHLFHVFYAILAALGMSAIYSIGRMILQPGWRP